MTRIITLFAVISLAAGCTTDRCMDIKRTDKDYGLVDPCNGYSTEFSPLDLKLTVKWTTATLPQRPKLKKLLVVTRPKPATGDGCADMWKRTAAAGKYGAALFTFPGVAGERGVTPIEDGDVVFWVYALDRAYNVLCQDESWCDASSQGNKCIAAPSGAKVCASDVINPFLGVCVKGAKLQKGIRTSATAELAPPVTP